MIRKILAANDPILRQKSKKVGVLDKKILAVIKDLKDTLGAQNDPEGVGLAAPQIGKLLRIFYARYGKLEVVAINPKVIKVVNEKSIKKTKDGHEIMEGCLSLPNYYGPLKRPKSVRVKYTNETGKEIEATFSGFHAQIILHEMDHLNGILFVDKLIEQRESLYKLKGEEWEEVGV